MKTSPASRPDWLEAIVQKALAGLRMSDKFLLDIDANERSITHRLALYLTPLCPDWDVDCEYNRDGHEPKRLHIPDTSTSQETDGSRVFPDIIVHKRGKKKTDNLLIIELKKSTSSRSNKEDLAKLRAFKQQLAYKYALFILVHTGSPSEQRFEVRWL